MSCEVCERSTVSIFSCQHILHMYFINDQEKIHEINQFEKKQNKSQTSSESVFRNFIEVNLLICC